MANRCTHASRCSTIRQPDSPRCSSVHCSAKSSRTCPKQRLYPARYTSATPAPAAVVVVVVTIGTVEFRFRYLTVSSRMSAFSNLFALDMSMPDCTDKNDNNYYPFTRVGPGVDQTFPREGSIFKGGSNLLIRP